MIVFSMSHLEIHKALMDDFQKLKIRAKMLIPKMAKQFKKDGKFPAWKWEEYIHYESKNRYLISFYAETPSSANRPEVKYISFIENNGQRWVTQFGCWGYRKYGELDYIATRVICYYSQHFFSRYRERVWKDVELSGNELICRYFTRNDLPVPVEMNEDVQRNYLEYGECAKYAFQVHDGTCFIRCWNEGKESTIENKDSDFISVVLFMTFVTSSMMAKSQNKAIQEGGIKYLTKYYESFLKDAMNESFIRFIYEKRMASTE